MTEEKGSRTSAPAPPQESPPRGSERAGKEPSRGKAKGASAERPVPAPKENPADKRAPATPKPKEDPAEWADPICVCEPEPYWQEVAEQLARKKE